MAVNINVLWDELGSLSEEECCQVLTRLFSVYEELYESDPKDKGAAQFFQKLESTVTFCKECNLNRR